MHSAAATLRTISGATASAWRFPLARLSPSGRRARLTVLIFHRVCREPDPLFPGEVDAEAFRARLGWAREMFNVLPLQEAVERLSRHALPERALAISFDDGYADNASVALPILRELGLTATFFVATGYLNGGRMWNDTVIEAIRRTSLASLDLAAIGMPKVDLADAEARRAAIRHLLPALRRLPSSERESRVQKLRELARAELPDDLMMNDADVQALAASGMGIGAHTISHPILATQDKATARREMTSSRDTLESLIGRRVRLFAYPNGKPTMDYRARHVAMAREVGFDAAFSTAPGAARAGDSLFELPRFTPWDATPMRWAMRLARNFLVPIERAAA